MITLLLVKAWKNPKRGMKGDRVRQGGEGKGAKLCSTNSLKKGKHRKRGGKAG